MEDQLAILIDSRTQQVTRWFLIPLFTSLVSLVAVAFQDYKDQVAILSAIETKRTQDNVVGVNMT